MAPRQRIILLGLAALVAVLAAVLIGTGGKDEPAPTTPAATTPAATTPAATTPATPATPALPTIVVRGGKPVGGVKHLTFRKGDTIAFAVRSDSADEVHVHGYDVARAVPAGGSVRFSIPAKIDGIFEVELEQTHEQIAELEVRP